MTKADHGYLTNVGISQEENRPHVMYVMWLRDANNLSPTFDKMEGLESLVVLGWRPSRGQLVKVCERHDAQPTCGKKDNGDFTFGQDDLVILWIF